MTDTALEVQSALRDRIFAYLREPCERVSCEERLVLTWDMYDDLIAMHGHNPEHVRRIPIQTMRPARDQEASQIRAWLERIHAPRPWETSE